MMEQLELLPKAKIMRARPTEPIVRSAELSDDGEYRWTLRRAWGSGPSIGWILLNPSLADGRKDDPTCWEMMCRSLRLGFGSMIVGNVYPFRSPSPRDLAAWIKAWRTDPAHPSRSDFYENGRKVGTAMRDCPTLVCAWGNHADRHDLGIFMGNFGNHYVDDPSDEDQGPIKFWCLGRTQSGAPVHPLARGKHRIPADQKLIPFQPSFEL